MFPSSFVSSLGSGPYSTPIGGAMGGNAFGRVRFVDSTNGSDSHSGTSITDAFATIQKAIDTARRGDTIIIAPGQYDETVTIGRTDENDDALNNLMLIGCGGRGATFIEPSTEDAGGLVCHADDVTLINLGVAAEDETAGNYALHSSGARLRAYMCKIEGGEQQIRIGPGTVAQEAAGTHGDAGDCFFYDCEIAWGTDGIVLVCTDFGAVTQLRFEKCRSHNITGKHITEEVGSGGSASVMFRNLSIVGWTFDDAEGGAAPTNYILLNGDNGNDGIVTDCSFPTAINSGLNLVSTALHWISNRHTGGISTGQPS